jgi:acetoin utilization protein AcuB
MQVLNRMTKNPISISLHTPVSEAREKMKKEKIHRLPVVDKYDHLQGIITEKDILYASPSLATSLDVYEISSLMARLEVHSVMTKDVITIGPDTPLEDAARIMADNNIGGLPIIDKGILVGIITESDLFRVFVELFGAREKFLCRKRGVNWQPFPRPSPMPGVILSPSEICWAKMLPTAMPSSRFRI